MHSHQSPEPTCSPEQALERAFWHIKLPSMTVLIVPLLAYMLLANLHYVPDRGYAGLTWASPFFIFSFVGGWLIWSVQVPRWRLWAYQRVSDIARLKELAIAQQIIWPDGSLFEKTEIMTKAMRKEIARLEASKQTNSVPMP